LAPAAGSAPRTGGPAPLPPSRLAPGAPGGGVSSAVSATPPAAPRPEAASPAPAAPADAGGFRERLLATVQSKKMSLRTYLEMARRVSLEGDVVEIAFGPKQSFSREAIENADARSTIEAAASEIAGRQVIVRTAIEAPGPDEPAPETGPARRDRLIEAAMRQPEVRMVMETFRGQIVDIQEIS